MVTKMRSLVKDTKFWPTVKVHEKKGVAIMKTPCTKKVFAGGEYMMEVSLKILELVEVVEPLSVRLVVGSSRDILS